MYGLTKRRHYNTARGPDYVYKCPHCDYLLKNKTLVNSNMGGAVRFSDGQCRGPKLPDFPDLTKCPKCNTIFWTSDLKELATVDLQKKTRIWKLATYVDFLPIDDLCRALEMFKEPGIERLIRIGYGGRLTTAYETTESI